jgi:hypothetical protein
MGNLKNRHREGSDGRTRATRPAAGFAGLLAALVCSVLLAAPGLAAAPANDGFDSATPLPPALPATIHGDLAGASTEKGEQGTGHSSVWYRWVPEQSGSVTLDACGAEGPWKVEVYVGATLTELESHPSPEQLDCQPRQMEVEAGTEYRLRVVATSSERPRFTIRLHRSGPPSNDAPAQAVDLGSALPLTVVGRTLEATTDSDRSAKDVWYSWQAPSSGVVNFSTCGTPDFGATLDIYGAGADRALVSSPSSSVGCSSRSNKQTIAVSAGSTYLVAASDPWNQGYHRLRIAPAQPPANDDFEDAQRVSGPLPILIEGTTVDATGGPSDPSEGRTPVSRNVWFSWTAPEESGYRIVDCRPAAISIMVHRGTYPFASEPPDARSCGRSTDEAGSGDSFKANAGETVWIQVGTRGVETPFEIGLAANPRKNPDREPGTTPSVSILSTSPEEKTRIRRLPISRRPGGQPRSVASLPIDGLVRSDGGRMETGGEVQLTVCLKPTASGSPRRGDCAGRLYGYDPRVSAYLGLGTSPGASAPSELKRLTPTESLTCTQGQPNRNHHCVITIARQGLELPSDALRGCGTPRRRCFVNLVVSAHHPAARRGESVILGGIDKRGRIDHRGKSRIFAGHFPAGVGASAPNRGKRMASRLPVAPEGKKAPMRVVYSQKIAAPERNEVLLVDGRYLGEIAQLPYNTRTRTAIVLAKGPRSTHHSARVATRAAATTTRIAEESNFNCTRGSSGHRSPCPIREQGVLRFGPLAGKDVYVNLLAGHGAIGVGSERHRGSDRARVRGGGFLKVRRYKPVPRQQPRPGRP